MNWENLTSNEFETAVDKSEKLCLIGMGVVEKHGNHLPLGQDFFVAHKLCTMAAEIEDAMVFPPFYFSRINEARHVPGTIAIKFELLIPLLQSICDEIYRNGFTKVLIVNGHGGNKCYLSYFLASLLEKNKPYMVFVTNPYLWAIKENILESKIDGHAGEVETSEACYLFPELVRNQSHQGDAKVYNRISHLTDLDIETSIRWYATCPQHVYCDDTLGSAEKGEKIVQIRLNKLVEIIRAIKQDKIAIDLYQKYLKESYAPSN